MARLGTWLSGYLGVRAGLSALALLLEGVYDDMPRAVTFASMAFRLLWVINLVLGILVAANILDKNATTSTPWTGTHVVLGIVLVALLWFLGTAVGLQARNATFPALTFVVGLLVAIVGASQQGVADPSVGLDVLRGIHIVLILSAIALAEVCAARYKRVRASEPIRAGVIEAR